jgi:hypothetical protein
MVHFKALKTILIVLFILFSSKSEAISIPSLSIPSSNSTANSFEVGLFVSAVTNATGYQFQYDTSNTFNSPFLQTDTTFHQYLYTKVLNKGRKYYWRAKAYKQGDTSAWSSVFTFTVGTKMDIGGPTNNSVGPVRGVYAYSWNVFYPATYLFEVDTTPAFNSPMHVFESRPNNAFIDTAMFQFGATIYWRATAINLWGDTLDWSNIFNYTIYNKPGLDKTGSVFANPRYVVNLPLTTGWSEIILEADTSLSFGSPALIEKTIPPYSARDTLWNLLFGANYYYRVRARFGGNLSLWSDTNTFKVNGPIYLNNPSNHSILSSLNVAFSWSRIWGTQTQFQLATDSNFTQLLIDTTIADAYGFTYTELLDLRKRYYTRLRLMHARDTTAWTLSDFTTYGGSINTYYPYNYAQNWIAKAAFRFYKETWADSYVVEMDTGVVFPSTPSSYFVRLDSFYTVQYSYITSIDTAVLYNQNYVWRMYAVKGTDTTDYSETMRFKTAAAPTLYFPQNNFIGIGCQTNGLIIGIDSSSYVQWEIDTSMLFNSPEYTTGMDVHVRDDFSPAYVELHLPGDRLFKAKYYWRARCINAIDTSEWSHPFWFTTTTDPWLTAPVNGGLYQSVKQTLKWSIQGSADEYRYQYQLGTSSNISANPIYTAPVGVFAEVDVSLDYTTKYYWRVRAAHSRDTSAWSPVWSFTTEDPPTLYPPTLVSPEANAHDLPLSSVRLFWFETVDATKYDFEVANNIYFDTILANGTTTSTTVYFAGVKPRTKFYWHVRSRLGNIVSYWSETRMFEIGSPVGLEELNNDVLFQLYPNPAGQYFVMKANQPFNVSVMNGQGVCLYQRNDFLSEREINIEGWPEGIYLVKVENDNGVFTRRLVIDR